MYFQANYKRVVEGLDDGETVVVDIPILEFENDANDIPRHAIIDFYQSHEFKTKFKIQDKKIISLNMY